MLILLDGFHPRGIFESEEDVLEATKHVATEDSHDWVIVEMKVNQYQDPGTPLPIRRLNGVRRRVHVFSA